MAEDDAGGYSNARSRGRRRRPAPRGLASLLGRSGFDVVVQAVDGAQLLAQARDKTPELVVADIRMPPTHSTEGLDAAR